MIDWLRYLRVVWLESRDTPPKRAEDCVGWQVCRWMLNDPDGWALADDFSYQGRVFVVVGALRVGVRVGPQGAGRVYTLPYPWERLVRVRFTEIHSARGPVRAKAIWLDMLMGPVT